MAPTVPAPKPQMREALEAPPIPANAFGDPQVGSGRPAAQPPRRATQSKVQPITKDAMLEIAKRAWDIPDESRPRPAQPPRRRLMEAEALPPMPEEDDEPEAGAGDPEEAAGELLGAILAQYEQLGQSIALLAEVLGYELAGPEEDDEEE